MPVDPAVTSQTVELLQQLIRNQCVNDGSVASGQEVRRDVPERRPRREDSGERVERCG